MKSWGTLRPAGIVLALVVGSAALGTAPAYAATDQEVAAWITEATLEKLNVTSPDSELAAALEAAVSAALEAGVISPAVEELAEEAIDEPDAVADEEIEEALDDELDEQGAAWDDVASTWRAAFDTIKADFADCREAAEAGANLCAHQFRYEMKVHHITAWQARHAAKIGDITALPEDEQAAALAKLEHQGELAAARLERARTQLEKKTGHPVDETPVAEDGTSGTEEPSDAPGASGHKGPKAEKSTGHGNKGNNGNNGNKGSNGSGNGKNGR